MPAILAFFHGGLLEVPTDKVSTGDKCFPEGRPAGLVGSFTNNAVAAEEAGANSERVLCTTLLRLLRGEWITKSDSQVAGEAVNLSVLGGNASTPLTISAGLLLGGELLLIEAGVHKCLDSLRFARGEAGGADNGYAGEPAAGDNRVIIAAGRDLDLGPGEDGEKRETESG